MSKYETDYLNNLQNLGIHTDRIIDEDPTLPYDSNSVSIKPNSEVNARNFNEAIEKLNHNFLYILANSRISKPTMPTSKSAKFASHAGSLRLVNYESNAESNLLDRELVGDIAITRTSDNAGTVGFISTKNELAAINYNDRNENLDSPNILTKDGTKEELILEFSGVGYNEDTTQRDDVYDRIVTIAGESINLLSTASGTYVYNPNIGVNNQWYNRAPALKAQGPVHYIQKSSSPVLVRGEPAIWVFRYDNYGYQLDKSTHNQGSDWAVNIYFSSEDVDTPDQVKEWKPWKESPDYRHFDPSEFTISISNQTPEGEPNPGLIEASKLIRRDGSSYERFKNIKAIEFDSNKNLFVLDDNIIYKYTTAPLTTNSVPDQTKPMREYVASIGGTGAISSKEKFARAKSMSIYDDHVYVVDQYGGHVFVKIYDANLNFVDIFNVSADMKNKTIIDILVGSKSLILSDSGTITEHDLAYTTVKHHKQFHNDYKLNTDVYKRLKRSSIDSTVFYVLTSNSVARKYFTKPNNLIGKFVEFDRELNGFGLAPSFSSGYDQILLYDYASYSLLRHMDRVDFHEALDTSIHTQIFELDKLKVSDEFVNSFVVNKALSKLIYNHELMLENLKLGFESKYTVFGPQIDRVLYPTVSALRKSEEYIENALIGLNEIVSSATFNRIIKRIHKIQSEVISIIKSNFNNNFPLDGHKVVISPGQQTKIIDPNPPDVPREIPEPAPPPDVTLPVIELPPPPEEDDPLPDETKPAPTQPSVGEITQRWEYDTGVLNPRHDAKIAVSASGNVFFGDSNGSLHCIDGSTGTQVWKITPTKLVTHGNPEWSDILLDETNQRVYGILATNGGTALQNIDMATGAAAVGSDFYIPYGRITGLTIDEGSTSIIYASSNIHVIWKIWWPFGFGVRQTWFPSEQGPAGGLSVHEMSRPVFKDSKAHVGFNGSVTFEDTFPRNPIEYTPPAGSIFAPHVPTTPRYVSMHDGKVWCAGPDFRVIALDLSDVNQSWAYNEKILSNRFTTGQIVFDSTRFFIPRQRLLYHGNISTGAVILPPWAMVDPNFIFRTPAIIDNERMYLTGGTHQLYLTDYTTNSSPVVDSVYSNLDQDEVFNAPPTVDSAGNVYAVTSKGILRSFDGTGDAPVASRWSQYGCNQAKTQVAP